MYCGNAILTIIHQYPFCHNQQFAFAVISKNVCPKCCISGASWWYAFRQHWLVTANRKPALVNVFGNVWFFVSQLENVLIFTANVAWNWCHQGNESYNELNCNGSITTAATVGSGQIWFKLQLRHRSISLYVIHSALSSIIVKIVSSNDNVIFV